MAALETDDVTRLRHKRITFFLGFRGNNSLFDDENASVTRVLGESELVPVF